jgi:ribosomal protein L32
MGTLFKVLLTVLVILVVWWVVKFRGRVSVLKAAVKAAKTVAKTEQAHRATAAAPAAPVSLVPCPKCGTYIAAGMACACSPESPPRA